METISEIDKSYYNHYAEIAKIRLEAERRQDLRIKAVFILIAVYVMAGVLR
jgi:hypothetical protein